MLKADGFCVKCDASTVGEWDASMVARRPVSLTGDRRLCCRALGAGRCRRKRRAADAAASEGGSSAHWPTGGTPVCARCPMRTSLSGRPAALRPRSSLPPHLASALPPAPCPRHLASRFDRGPPTPAPCASPPLPARHSSWSSAWPRRDGRKAYMSRTSGVWASPGIAVLDPGGDVGGGVGIVDESEPDRSAALSAAFGGGLDDDDVGALARVERVPAPPWNPLHHPRQG